MEEPKNITDPNEQVDYLVMQLRLKQQELMLANRKVATLKKCYAIAADLISETFSLLQGLLGPSEHEETDNAIAGLKNTFAETSDLVEKL
jgi:hypothetical protein